MQSGKSGPGEWVVYLYITSCFLHSEKDSRRRKVPKCGCRVGIAEVKVESVACLYGIRTLKHSLISSRIEWEQSGTHVNVISSSENSRGTLAVALNYFNLLLYFPWLLDDRGQRSTWVPERVLSFIEVWSRFGTCCRNRWGETLCFLRYFEFNILVNDTILQSTIEVQNLTALCMKRGLVDVGGGDVTVANKTDFPFIVIEGLDGTGKRNE